MSRSNLYRSPTVPDVVTSQQLQDMQPQKPGDVFAHDASVSDNGNPYNAWATYPSVRGMQIDWQNGFTIDGLPFNSYGITMPYEQLESVELLKGLSGFMYGFGARGHVTYNVAHVPGLKVGANARFTGNTTVRPAGDLTAGGYTLINVGATYATYATKIGGYGVTLRAAIDNIMNKRYWEYQCADYISPGDPRTLSLNARIDF